MANKSDLRNAIVQLAQRPNGAMAARDVLHKYGCDNLQQVPADKYDDVERDLRAALDGVS